MRVPPWPPPDASGRAILLSLRRMNAITALDTAARQVTCEAGVVLQTLHDAAETQGLRFPLTLGGKGSATVWTCDLTKQYVAINGDYRS